MIDAAIWKVSTPVPVRERPPKPERIITSSPDTDRLRQALAAIPNNDVPYDDWFRIACGVHHATDGEGLEVFREWSARSAKHDDSFLDGRVWPYIQVERGGDVITADYVLKAAERNGWQDPATADDFDVVETPPGEAEEKEAAPMFTPIRVSEFAAGKPMDWLIKNVLPRADVGMVFGASGSGKSFLLIDMACSIARGVPWRDKAVKKGRVCYVVAEGSAGFRKRVDAYCLHHDVAIADLDMYIIADAPNLNEKTHVKALIAGIKAAGPFDVIVLDTLAAVSAGADENSAQDMGVILERARAVGRAAGAMTLLVHHAGKQADRGARGSTALKGRVDVEIEVVRADNDRAATVSKLRDQEDGASFGFKLHTIPVGMDDEGEIIDSCVIEHTETSAAALGKGPAGTIEKKVHEIVLNLLSLDGEWPTEADIKAAVLEKVAHAGGRDMRWTNHRRALMNLVKKGVFVVDGVRFKALEAEGEE